MKLQGTGLDELSERAPTCVAFLASGKMNLRCPVNQSEEETPPRFGLPGSHLHPKVGFRLDRLPMLLSLPLCAGECLACIRKYWRLFRERKTKMSWQVVLKAMFKGPPAYLALCTVHLGGSFVMSVRSTPSQPPSFDVHIFSLGNMLKKAFSPPFQEKRETTGPK